MEYRMRRFKQLLSHDEALGLLNECTNGVLSLTDIDGTPYGVPVSYACDGDGHIYFHSAAAGRKIDLIGNGARCSFCAVARDDIRPEEFTSYFRSVIVAGYIQVVSDSVEIDRGLRLLCDKYSPGIDPDAEIGRCLKHVKVLRLDVESMTGKEAIELVGARKQ